MFRYYQIYFIFEQFQNEWKCRKVFSTYSERKASKIFRQEKELDENPKNLVLINDRFRLVEASPIIPKMVTGQKYRICTRVYIDNYNAYKKWLELPVFCATNDEIALQAFLLSGDFWNSSCARWSLQRITENGERKNIAEGPGPCICHTEAKLNLGPIWVK